MSDAKLQQMLDYKDIIELKHRFGRLADAKDWEGFRKVFAADATFDLGMGEIIQGADAYVNAVRDMLEGAVSLHRFLMPEITFASATEASGIWMLNDYNEWPSDPVTGERCGYKGYGREYETYRKIDGDWKITSWRLRYDRLDPLPREPLPATIQGGPAALRDEAYLRAVVNPRGC
ncbi:MAG: nuclear transport factor 2 family protein [Novosphingobium sp.]|nr:nuclear transport factor 2 family protein [Novosphingobium sp.]